MGQFCWMCDRMRPNEAFSGRNRRRHLCRDCARIPKAERDREARLTTLWKMLDAQSNISPKNICMALAWAAESDAEVGLLAGLVAEIGRAHPRRKKRLPHIRRTNPDLWSRMIAAGLVEDWGDQPPDWLDEEVDQEIWDEAEL